MIFNFNQFSLSFPDTERYGGFVNAEHKVWGDQLVAYADLFYQNVKVHNELAASATGTFLARDRRLSLSRRNIPWTESIPPRASHTGQATD